jgi:glycosyltransferase involved in cell wall biosynthesis
MIAAALPPRLDGIGDYTALLAAELARQAEVTILSGQEADTTPIPDVRIVPAFSHNVPASTRNLLRQVRQERPDWVLVQYNPFAYGKWGLNPYLPLVIRAIARDGSKTRISVMFHEVSVPAISAKFAVMAVWQRCQSYMLARAAHHLCFSTEAWARSVGRWFPGKPALVLPVGSNIPRVQVSRQEARARLGIRPEQLVIGLFGTAHPSRMMPLMGQACTEVRNAGHDVLVLNIGPNQEAFRSQFGNLPVVSDGALPAAEVSLRFAAMDIYLVAFVDGISVRRTSLMTGLQHGVATVATAGVHTDALLNAQAGAAFLTGPVQSPQLFIEHTLSLAREPEFRATVGGQGRCLYEREFAWPTIANRLIASLLSDQGS